MHYYFDKEFLKQYLSLGYPIKVYITGVYYDIASESELVNDEMFVCYDIDGKQFECKYKSIEHILVNNAKITRKQLAGGEGEPSGESAPKEESFKRTHESTIPSIRHQDGAIERIVDFNEDMVITRVFDKITQKLEHRYRKISEVSFLI